MSVPQRVSFNIDLLLGIIMTLLTVWAVVDKQWVFAFIDAAVATWWWSMAWKNRPRKPRG